MLQHWDESIILFFQSIRCDVLTAFFKLFIPLEIWLWFALVVVLFFLLRTREIKLPFISFFLARQMSFYCFNWAKDFFHRPRPYQTIPHAVPVMTVHGFSFPSGHSTLAMAAAVVLGYHFPKARWAVYTLAFLTGLSRIYLGVHYLSDVLGGFILGALLGCLGIVLEKAVVALTKGVKLSKKFNSMGVCLLVLLFAPLTVSILGTVPFLCCALWSFGLACYI